MIIAHLRSIAINPSISWLWADRLRINVKFIAASKTLSIGFAARCCDVNLYSDLKIDIFPSLGGGMWEGKSLSNINLVPASISGQSDIDLYGYQKKMRQGFLLF